MPDPSVEDGYSGQRLSCSAHTQHISNLGTKYPCTKFFIVNLVVIVSISCIEHYIQLIFRETPWLQLHHDIRQFILTDRAITVAVELCEDIERLLHVRPCNFVGRSGLGHYGLLLRILVLAGLCTLLRFRTCLPF